MRQLSKTEFREVVEIIVNNRNFLKQGPDYVNGKLSYLTSKYTADDISRVATEVASLNNITKSNLYTFMGNGEYIGGTRLYHNEFYKKIDAYLDLNGSSDLNESLPRLKSQDKVVAKSMEVSQEGNIKGEVVYDSEMDPKDVLRQLGINPDNYTILNFWVKTHPSGKVTHSINAKPLTYAENTKSLIEEYAELKDYIKENPLNIVTPNHFPKRKDNEYAALVAIFDTHLGRITMDGKTTLETQRREYSFFIDKLIDRTLTQGVPAKWIFPIGNDYFNSEYNLATTKGTPQDNTINMRGVFKTGLTLLVECINKLASYAPVEVVYVPSNHDRGIGLSLAVSLAEIFSGSNVVTVDDTANTRKYIQYGINGIMLEHGELKPDDYPSLFVAEAPFIFANTTNRIAVLGHKHHDHAKEVRSMLLKWLGAIVSPDRWHLDKGYISKKKAYSILLSPTEGTLGEFCVIEDALNF